MRFPINKVISVQKWVGRHLTLDLWVVLFFLFFLHEALPERIINGGIILFLFRFNCDRSLLLYRLAVNV